MKFSCQKDILLNAVQTTAKAAAAKSTIPALEGVLLELEGDILKVTGYNLEIGIRTEIPVTGEESGAAVVNARMAAEMIRKMPSAGLLFFENTDGNLAKIYSGETSFEVLCMSAAEYPSVPEINPEKSFSLPQKLLKSMINQTKYACAVVDTKPALMGCKFEINDNVLNVVAVDGVRIALRQEPVVYDNIEFIVPTKTLEELTHILADDNEKNVTLCIDRNQISFDVDGYTMISRLIDGEFIPYMKHLTCDDSIHAEVNCREIIEMLDRSMLVITDKGKCPIRCEFSGDTLSVSCSTAIGKINDKINIKYNGNPVTIGLNAKYLLDAFKACDTDCAKLVLSESSVAPVIIVPMEGRAFTFLLLPMRLK